MSQLGSFSIDLMKLFRWSQETRIMLLQHCYNISHIETVLQQQPYCSQIWQVDCRFFTIFLKLKTLWPLFMGGIQLSQG